MTTKRFQWVFIKDNELELRDNGIVKRFNNERLEELLNELHEEAKDNEHYHSEVLRLYKAVSEKNEQLKERNNRQAKQLDRLYHLISQKDWRTLTDIMDDFKKAEEQLQQESRTYGDLE